MNASLHEPVALTPNFFRLGTPAFPAYLSMGEVGMIIEGGTLGGGEVDSHGDHRVAMAFAMAALAATGPIRILNCANVATSFPGFEALAAAAGLRISR